MTYDRYDDPQDRFSRMMAAVDERLSETHGERADIYVADVQPLDKDSCYALLSYANGLPAPTTANVVDFVGRQFGGKVRPVLETARNFVDHNAVLIMLAKYQPSRPIEDTAGMHTIIAGARYLDVELKATWDVAVTPEGTKYLRRVSDDDVSSMVAERKQRMAVAGVAELTVAKALGGGASSADTGDVVRCYWQGSVYSDCEIKSVQGGNRLSVKIPNVGTVTVAREAVIEVQAISKQKAGQMKSKLADYYRQAMPEKDYANQLTDQLLNEGADSLPPGHWSKQK